MNRADKTPDLATMLPGINAGPTTAYGEKARKRACTLRSISRPFTSVSGAAGVRAGIYAGLRGNIEPISGFFPSCQARFRASPYLNDAICSITARRNDP